ncbi:MAG: hypothetical protein IPM07_01480 [Anaerolineales bacterium]|nr:hypothetical protein [Anaerolineales bacterium]
MLHNIRRIAQAGYPVKTNGRWGKLSATCLQFVCIEVCAGENLNPSAAYGVYDYGVYDIERCTAVHPMRRLLTKRDRHAKEFL